jgi:hypothetical protein
MMTLKIIGMLYTWPKEFGYNLPWLWEHGLAMIFLGMLTLAGDEYLL